MKNKYNILKCEINDQNICKATGIVSSLQLIITIPVYKTLKHKC